MLWERFTLLARIDRGYSLLQVFPSSSRIILTRIVNFDGERGAVGFNIPQFSNAAILLSRSSRCTQRLCQGGVADVDELRSIVLPAWDLDSLFVLVSTVSAYSLW
jgi:hypothetical protein